MLAVEFTYLIDATLDLLLHNIDTNAEQTGSERPDSAF